MKTLDDCYRRGLKRINSDPDNMKEVAEAVESVVELKSPDVISKQKGNKSSIIIE